MNSFDTQNERNEVAAKQYEEERQGYSRAENAVALELAIRRIKNYERQKPIGAYFADFFFPDWNLVLEVDGADYHSTKEQIEHDRVRDTFMKNKGLMVVRVSGSVVNKNIPGVIQLLPKLAGLNKPMSAKIKDENDIKDIYRILLSYPH